MSPKTLKIFFHDSCFDGATTAALFSHFYTERIAPGAELVYQGVQHQRGDPFAGFELDGDDNACVDFRYVASERLTWWFDHHASAFQPPSLRAHFEADRSGQKFYDPAAPSCAGFCARVLAERFGWQPEGEIWAELLHWAELIDAARFESPAQAVERAEPALEVMTWLEHNRDAALTERLIRALGSRPLAELAAEPWIREPLAPILERNHHDVELVRARAVCDAGVVFFDLADEVASPSKFIPYLLYPEARYTVSVTRSPDRVKVSVGFNPWSKAERQHDLSKLCERFGGGGHPVVGAVTLAAGELEHAREVARLIRDELMSPPR